MTEPHYTQVIPQFGASLTDDSRVVINNFNVLIIKATGSSTIKIITLVYPTKLSVPTRECYDI